jgi:raffinose/stachyose/melibiose transport system permease protein
MKKGMTLSGRYWMLYLLPALFFYVVFMAYPLLDSLKLSFFSGNPTGARTFVGFDNFITLFTDPDKSARYFGAFGHTCIFFAIHMLVQNSLGILFAVILTDRTMQHRELYRTIIFIPTTLAILITGYLWKLILNPVWSGPVFEKIGLGFLVKPWLGNNILALPIVALVSCWQWVGIPTMMFTAALQNIPVELIEAGRIEGASNWNIFRKIKIPMIMPVIGMIAILTFVNNFNAFDVVFAMENVNGAPGYSTDIIGTLFYRVGIAGQHPVGIPDTGLGAAIATITFLVLCLGVIPTLRKTQTKND